MTQQIDGQGGGKPPDRSSVPPSPNSGTGRAVSQVRSRAGATGPEAPTAARQRVFGDFVIEREIGRGGMGVVWLATQKSLGRRVALKALPNFAAMDASAVLRFRREAEATGRIAHPGIVPVYGVGEVDGIHYFAMEFIDGPPLGSVLESLGMRQVDKLKESWIEEAQLGDRYPALREPPTTGAGNRYVRSCARLVADVANALAAAHQERVIHRDLKPNNILIHPAGRPVLVDFGLARDEQANNLTRSGEQIGTPGYMAPEQARGHRQIDVRVDVYGLGAVLYELLTLRPPFEGATSAEIAHKILTEDPVPVQRRNPNVPVDLAAIVHRCLAKSPDDRYPVIEAVELDLRNFLAGKPVAASLPGAIARLRGSMQRNRQSLVIGTTAALAATAIAIGAGVVGNRGKIRSGREALVEAKRMLAEARDPARARDLYERAAALLGGAQEVAEQRRRDFREVFPQLYDDHANNGAAVLRRFAAVFGDEEKPMVGDLLARLAGQGRLHFATRTLEQATRSLEVRKVSADGLQTEWCQVNQGSPLAIGEYLVRATSTDGAVAVLQAAVQADQETTIEPRYLGDEELPADRVAVADPATGRLLAVERYEVTRAQWRQWLQTIADPQLRREMTPLQWDGGERNGDLPVRGLSFHQARAFAIQNGGHLPSAREQWLAGSAGLSGLSMPWGTGADRARVVADPFQRSEAMPVASMPEGQSPIGVHHVLGNVAEILSAAADGRLLMGGGSFLDDPATLALDGKAQSVSTAPLPAFDRGHAAAGLRLYRYVGAADDPKAAASAQQRREELHAGGGAVVFHDWKLNRDGTLECEIEMNGVFTGEAKTLVQFDTPGFLQMAGTVRRLDGHRQASGPAAIVAPGGEHSVVAVELPASLRTGQGYRYWLQARLQPVDGMLPFRDGYVLRLPMKRGYSVAQVYALELPEGCAVEEVSPPATTWTMGGRTWLSWEQTASGQIETAIVRLRTDGGFGDAAVARETPTTRCREFLAAWNSRSRLDALLDRDFVRLPGNQNRAATLAQSTGERLQFQGLVDSVRVGDIETSEISVDWSMPDRDGNPFVLQSWPLLLQWRHDGPVVRALRLQPITMVDQGRYETGGGYSHEGRMRVRIDAVPDSTLVRTQDELCELQVKLARAGFEAQILGTFADAAESLEAIRFRLTNGAFVLRPGRLLDQSDGDAEKVQEWMFPGNGEQKAARERWQFVQRGSRHFLIRFAVVDRDAKAAAAAFASAAAQEWFQRVSTAVRIL